MAWIYTPDPQYRGARVDDGGTSRRVRIQVQTDDRNADESAVQLNSGYTWGQSDPLDANKKLRSIEVNRGGQNPYYWEILLEYRGDVISGGDPGNSQISPLERPPEYEWSYEEKDEPVDIDTDGKPICTAVGESFDPPITRPFADLIARVTFFTDSWDAATMLGLVNSLNNKSWYGWPSGTVRFCAPRARSYLESPWPVCFQRTYTFAVRPDGWQPRVLHAGLMEWDGTYDEETGFKNTRQIKSNDGKLVEKPWPLDAEGRAIAIGADGRYVSDPIFLTFKLFREIDFSVFGV